MKTFITQACNVDNNAFILCAKRRLIFFISISTTRLVSRSRTRVCFTETVYTRELSVGLDTINVVLEF